MCGIVGYVGKRPVQDLLLAGLTRLEYRGYDSAGISMISGDAIDSVRAVGNLDHLRDAVSARIGADEPGGVATATRTATTGIGHTRWATHGRVNEENAHPHFDTTDRVHIVVNGIVENYLAMRERLSDMGAVFTSETDAEVIAHLIAHHMATGSLLEAVRAAYNELEGHYAFVAMSLDEPETLVGARKECPLIVGRGEGETFFASAIPAFLGETRQVQYIENGEIVEITPEGTTFILPDGTELEREIVQIDWDQETAEKGGFDTFMLKEIHEQADALAETIADRTVRADGVDLNDDGALDEEILRGVERIIVVACGTSYHAGLIGRYAIEEWARIPVEMDVASEYRYRNPVVGPGDLVIGITQSGETADTLAAMRIARERGATVLALTNIMGSQATRDADGVLYTRAGLEVGVAATKTFTCQVAVMIMLALKLAELRGTLPAPRRAEIIADLKRIPHCIEELLSQRRPAGARDRRRALGQGVLPLPRAPRRASGGARGRAQAQGDLLHLHRRLRGGRDEARPDRAARRVHAGRRRRHRFARAREGRLQHAGGARPRRARDRHRHRGQRRHRRARRVGRAHPAHRLDAAAAAGRDPAAAAGLPHRAPARAQRRPAAQPREDRHGRVATAMTWGLAPSRLGSVASGAPASNVGPAPC